MSDAIDAKETKPKWIPPRAGMGRPKGSKNKFTTNIKEAILESFQRLGGVDYLEEQGRKNPVAYLMLLKSIMPLQVSGVDGQPIMVITGVIRDGDDVGDDVGQIEHSPVPATIEAKAEPLPPPQETAPAAPRPGPYMSPPRAAAAPEPPQEQSGPVRSVRRALGAPWS
jgi:hypothetical protein